MDENRRTHTDEMLMALHNRCIHTNTETFQCVLCCLYKEIPENKSDDKS